MAAKSSNHKRGFTMVELLVALMVCSIVLAATATLIGATSCAKTATDQMGRNGAVLMQLQNRLSDLLIRANQVHAVDGLGFWLWHDKNSDDEPHLSELTRIRKSFSGNGLCVVDGGEYWYYPQCRNIKFAYNKAAPATDFVTVWFDITDNGVSQTYTVSGALRCGD